MVYAALTEGDRCWSHIFFKDRERQIICTLGGRVQPAISYWIQRAMYIEDVLFTPSISPGSQWALGGRPRMTVSMICLRAVRALPYKRGEGGQKKKKDFIFSRHCRINCQ